MQKVFISHMDAGKIKNFYQIRIHDDFFRLDRSSTYLNSNFCLFSRSSHRLFCSLVMKKKGLFWSSEENSSFRNVFLTSEKKMSFENGLFTSARSARVNKIFKTNLRTSAKNVSNNIFSPGTYFSRYLHLYKTSFFFSMQPGENNTFRNVFLSRVRKR